MQTLKYCSYSPRTQSHRNYLLAPYHEPSYSFMDASVAATVQYHLSRDKHHSNHSIRCWKEELAACCLLCRNPGLPVHHFRRSNHCSKWFRFCLARGYCSGCSDLTSRRICHLGAFRYCSILNLEASEWSQSHCGNLLIVSLAFGAQFGPKEGSELEFNLEASSEQPEVSSCQRCCNSHY